MEDTRRTEPFRLRTEMKPSGDQPAAIEKITDGLRRGLPSQVLLGVTGSGKTFTMANVIANLNRPALVLSHNKTLAAQLYREFKELFPQNAVEYFVSYYDYYMPEAYIAASDTYIEKDSAINDELDKMRIAATKHLLERRDVIIVSSVSCIYGIGSPQDFHSMVCNIEEGQELKRDDFLRNLVSMLYTRTQHDFARGSFRVRGDVVDVFPAYEDALAIRVTFFDDEIESIHHLEPLRGLKIRRLKFENIFPASHYVTARDRLEKAMDAIADEMAIRVEELKQNNRIVEATRLYQRTMFDLEMMREMGTCKGIENYSRHLAGRGPGDPPNTLLDYFPEDFVLFVDESHVTLPQVRAMYRGDRARKETLVEFGFRLPSALDNRPLKGEEFEQRIGQTVYVSATPSDYELGKAGGVITELVVRPTGLLDPPIEVRPAVGQVDDLLGEIRTVVSAGWRVLATTLTKRFAEELVDYFADLGVRVRYLHSDIDAIERTRIIHGLRAGEFDVLVGINLLREGLDLPEVALVAVLDADKEGFLRSSTALIQTCGRAARNLDGRVIMYADRITDSMKACLDETERRRALQAEYNAEHGISPKGITKKVGKILDSSYYEEDPDEAMLLAREGHEDEERYTQRRSRAGAGKQGKKMKTGRAKGPGVGGKKKRGTGSAAAAVATGAMAIEELARDPKKLHAEIRKMRDEMKKAAAALDFEEAALLRDRLKELEKHVLIDMA